MKKKTIIILAVAAIVACGAGFIAPVTILPNGASAPTLQFRDTQNPAHVLTITIPTNLGANSSLTLPAANAVGGLNNDGAGNLSWSAAGGGANTALSNLTNPTAVNQGLVPGTGGTISLGSSSKQWVTVFTAGVFDNTVGLFLSELQNQPITFSTNGSTRMAISGSGVVSINGLAGSGTQCVQVDNSGNISGTGSACGSGGVAGANTTLSNLTSPTAVNQNLWPQTTNTQALGAVNHEWAGVASPNIFTNQAVAMTIGPSSNQPLQFFTNNIQRMQIAAGGVVSINSLAGAGTQCLQADNSGNISGSGSSCASSSGANTSLSNLTNPTAVNQGLVPGTGGTISLGSTLKEWVSVFASGFEDNSGLGMTIAEIQNQPIYFLTNNTERMRIVANGHVLINKTVDAVADLQVEDNTAAATVADFRSTGQNAVAVVGTAGGSLAAGGLFTGDIPLGVTNPNGGCLLIDFTGLNIPPTGLFNGAGSPNGTCKANPGSFYLNTNGGAGTTLYVKETGVNTNTGWVAK